MWSAVGESQRRIPRARRDFKISNANFNLGH
jgi:hypothetical protein